MFILRFICYWFMVAIVFLHEVMNKDHDDA